MVLADSDRISHVPPYSGYWCQINRFRVRGYHPYRLDFQLVPLTIHLTYSVLQPQSCRNKTGLGYFHFARRYYGNHYCFLFLCLLRCFSSASLRLSTSYLQYDRFPHSDMFGSQNICFSPNLFAAYHVLLRLWEPRHSPCALSNLLVSYDSFFTYYYFNQFQYVKELYCTIKWNQSFDDKVKYVLFIWSFSDKKK